ncbi:endoplasmic reticulum lectin 1 isoform X2 [Arctopsyche grandis]|uniref:endoplasmic reticulum lectin 1 isoform X2 n=1 Tax=Arctopsyche grandis TaxID=121162 RepID=UPI00406D926D
MILQTFYLVLVCFLHSINCHDFKGFDDTIQFKINWPGKLDNINPDNEVLDLMTAHHEKYQCYIPLLSAKNSEESDQYEGFSPLQLLSPLFYPQLCSYRVESYWTYEVCHGQYVRQYHEEREGKKAKLQEYFLGRWDAAKQKKLEEEMVNALVNDDKLKFKKIEGLNLPYVEFEMDDGTLCDLNNKPRMTKVQYVCFSHRKHEIYTFKETSTCEYEVTILSPLLCSHPLYKPKDSEENLINCLPVDNAPKKPRSVLAMEAESLKFNKKIQDGEARVKMELHPIDYDSPEKDVKPIRKLDLPPNELVRAFLEGENCLEGGGTGWWKYDFCYGKYVKQVHIDEKAGFQTTVLLGEFFEDDHLEWIAQNPQKRPKPKGPQRTQISHFYSRGNECSQTRKPRQTEVKLKCLENASSPSQVSLYLLEPKICQYILGIESPLICEILDMADDNGIISWPNSMKRITDRMYAEKSKESSPSTEATPKKDEETASRDKEYKNNEL